MSKKTTQESEATPPAKPVFTGRVIPLTAEVLTMRAGLTSRLKEDFQHLFIGMQGHEKEVLERRRRGAAVGKIMQFFGMLEDFVEHKPETQKSFVTFYEQTEQEAMSMQRSNIIEIVSEHYEHPVLTTLNAVDAITHRTDFRDTNLIPMQRASALIIERLANGELPTKS